MNTDIQQLEERKQGFIDKARSALTAGRVDEGAQYRVKAEKAQKAIEEMRALDSVSAPATPMRPPLPGSNGNGSGSLASKDRATAAYYIQFGEQDSAIKAILHDLHGTGYEQAYWQQRGAFKTYLRRGEQGLGSDDYKLLKSIVMTPSSVKSALDKGFDSVAALKATMVEAIDTLGGFAVPVDFQSRVLERLQGMTIMRRRASVDSTSRDVVEIPVSTGGDDQYTSAVRVTWVDETPVAGVAATNMTFGMESIPIHTVMAETGLSRNLIEDSAFDIENFLTKKFAEASSIDEDNKFLTGTGVGSPQGLLPGGTNVLGLAEKKTGDANLLTWGGLIDLSYAIASQYRNGSVWIGERATYGAIAKMQEATSGEYLWNPFQFAGGAEGAPRKLLGYETLEQEVMPSVAANAYPIIFGDPSGYQIFDRIGMTVERYLDSNTARQNMVIYVMRRRLGGQPIEPWRFAVQKVAA